METLFSRVASTVSSPAVNYSGEYEATRSGNSVSFRLVVKAWLNSSGSRLGQGAKLTIKARVNGGQWYEGVIKAATDTWSGTAQHSVEMSMPFSSTSDKCTVEIYVTRHGSTYGGTAGELGSANNPYRYTANIPGYQPTPTPDPPEPPEPAAGTVRVKHQNQWKPAAVYVRHQNRWKPATVYVRSGNRWR